MKSRVEHYTDQCEILTIEKKQREGSPYLFSNSVGVIADVHQDGTVVEAPNVPFQLNFHSPLKDRFADSPNHFDTPWYETLRDGVAEGDTIFEVYAYSPEDGEVHVANVVMESELQRASSVTNVSTSATGIQFRTIFLTGPKTNVELGGRSKMWVGLIKKKPSTSGDSKFPTPGRPTQMRLPRNSMLTRFASSIAPSHGFCQISCSSESKRLSQQQSTLTPARD